ncbi:MAG: serpin family protein [Prevotellaceae bacterium]|nr:serpin family protein [Prevotellaceae bacterium]
MKKTFNNIALTATVLLALSACSSTKKISDNKSNDIVSMTTEEEIDPEFMVLSDAQYDLVKRNNNFALNLFSEMKGVGSNVVSPISVTYLMAMLANGAEASTREEIMDAIGAKDFDIDEMNAFYAYLIRRAKTADKHTTLNIANYIALNKEFKLKKKFASTIADSYQGAVESLDFTNPESTKRINGWCSEHTNNMIPTIIDQVEPSAVAYILNAIYFNGTWTDKFDKNNTKKEQFNGYTRDIMYVDMMHRNAKYYYTSNDVYSAVTLPYGSGAYSMTVILPNEGKFITDLTKTLNADTIASLRRNMEECLVDLKLPRFTTEMKLPLKGIVAKLGAPSMFDATRADFSSFANGNVYVSEMLQKAKIEVSEEGTKAAAVTMGMVKLTSMRPQEPRRVDFHCDRPFVYMIQDNYTGAILFMGQFTGK